MRDARPWLLSAGWTSVTAGIAHFICLVGGPTWFIFMGTPRRFAYAASRGEALPVAITLFLAGMLFVWAAFAFSAAGVLRRLPLRRLALTLISIVLLGRGFGYFAVPKAHLWRPDLSQTFLLWSSAICVLMGVCFAVGTWRAWPQLSQRIF